MEKLKRTLCLLFALLLVCSQLACAPAADPAEPAVGAETAAPASSDPIEAAATAEVLRELIAQYQSESDYEMVYKAAMRLIELEPTDTDAYIAAMDALSIMASSNYEQINELLTRGIESAQNPQALVEWANSNQPDYSLELPFLQDYESVEEINTAGITCGNLINDCYKQDICWEVGLLTSQGSWIYFTRPDENFAIYKMRMDGSEYQRIGETYGNCINVVGDWIYFRDTSGEYRELCKMRTDGSEYTKLLDGYSDYISVSGDWIYYGNGNENFRFYKVRTDGSENMALTEVQALYTCVYGDWAYYCPTDGSGFFRTSIDGSETEKLSARHIDLYCMADDWIYYLSNDDNYSVRRMHLDGSEDEEVLRWEEPIATMNIAGDSMVLSVNNDGISGQIIIVDFNNFEVVNTFEQSTDAIYVDNVGNVYFIDYNSLAWYRIDTDTGRLFTLPFGSPTLLKLGFDVSLDEGLCSYVDMAKGADITIYSDAWNVQTDEWKKNVIRFYKALDSYYLVIAYCPNSGVFEAQMFEGDEPNDYGVQSYFKYDLANGTLLDAVSQNSELEPADFFAGALGLEQTAAIYTDVFAQFESYTQDKFGLTPDELFAMDAQ